MFFCGKRYSQIDDKPNKIFFEKPIISPPTKFHIDPTSLSSISNDRYQTVYITKNGQSYVRGDNSSGIISGSLPEKTFYEDNEYVLKDEGGHPYKFISVVCGGCYTLYLVSNESTFSNLKLVYCYANRKPNPLFLNIGNRIPRAIFGGNETSGVIDNEGGIIIISNLIFSSPTQKIEATFLPNGDKAVKLAFCNDFVISLGHSGKVYLSKISDPKFSEVKELSGKKAIDVAGTLDHCFVVLNNGRVFGRGNNTSHELGLPENATSKSAFTEIISLSKYKIVSAFAACNYSVFKTSEGKMIACGNNYFARLFIKKKKNIVYPPEEVKKFRGFNFCLVGNDAPIVFIGIDPPPNIGNKKIIEELDGSEKVKKSSPKIIQVQSSSSSLSSSSSTSSSSNEIDDSKKSQSSKDEEISQLKLAMKEKDEKISQLKLTTKKKDEKISRLKEENMRLKEEITNLTTKIKSYSKKSSDSDQDDLNLELFDCKTIDDLNVVKTIGRGGQSEVFEVTRQQKLALKVLFISGATNDTNSESYKSLQHLRKEYQTLGLLNHRNIIQSFGLCYGDEEHTPSILLEFCPKNLNEAVFDMSSKQKVCCIVEIIIAMEAVHALNLIHRSLKPENILIDEEGHVKISDFGISYLVDVQNQSKIAGTSTLKFMAPELLNENNNYTNKVDVYSFGVILFFVLTGRMPKIIVKDLKIGKKADIPKSVNKFSRSLINKCWSTDADDRPSFTEILDTVQKNNFKLIDGVDSDEIKSFLSL